MDFFAALNPPQQEAVQLTEGPLLILAGAGSGKTRVLTSRIAYLIREKQVPPWHILAITFTNKAAGEMRERIDRAVGMEAGQIWVGTFHATCCRILRSHIDRLGYDRSFTIYDTDDSRQVIKEAIRQLELDPKVYKERALLARISAAKNEMMDPDAYEASAAGWTEQRTAEVYRVYQERLQKNNALDFDDLLIKTVTLFKQEKEVLAAYRERFQYILVDEYQDTNTVQFELVRLLAGERKNICVVGDDDQSIYKFRGANIRNILSFEEHFPGTSVIRLEQNYRSTPQILQAANAVIAHNTGRKEKTLWTENAAGEPVRFLQFATGQEEAEAIIDEIAENASKDKSALRETAVLYRTNAQSRLFEEQCVYKNIPYQIVGGVHFYARKEIKDMLAYLKTVDNGLDDLSVKRVLNIPKRGVGQTTIAKLEQAARERGCSFYESLEVADQIDGIGRARQGIASFLSLISVLRGAAKEYLSVRQLLEKILQETGYLLELQAEDTEEARARIENLEELLSKAESYEESAEEPSLSDFLQQVSLVADIDSVSEGDDRLLLMTLHAAKGLEFDNVYLAGMEENTFPSYMSIGSEDEEELEEERRLCYVGMTRARKRLTLTAAQTRMVRGETRFNLASRFVREIPQEMLALSADTTDTKRFRKGTTEPKAISSSATGIQHLRKTNPAWKMREFTVQKEDHLTYQKGDRVMHSKFGAGTVTEIRDGSKDFEVTVCFDQVGIKRMFASFAKLQKITEESPQK